jgi:DNA-binding HxlR family transcriptional regulator
MKELRAGMRCSGNFPESFQKTLEILPKRWTSCLVLFVLGLGPLRFNEIAAQFDIISDRMLSERLKDLEATSLPGRRLNAEHAYSSPSSLSGSSAIRRLVARNIRQVCIGEHHVRGDLSSVGQNDA